MGDCFPDLFNNIFTVSYPHIPGNGNKVFVSEVVLFTIE